VDRISRKDLKTDRFAQEVTHTVEYLSEHRRSIMLWGGIALGILILVAGVWMWRSHSHAKRQEMLTEALRIQNANIGQPTGNPFLLTFPTQAERDKAATKAFEDIIAKHPGTYEAYVSRYYLGVIAADNGKVTEAQKAFEEVARKADKETASLAKLALAQVLAAQNKIPDAEKVLRELIEKPTTLVSKEQATIALGRILADTHPADARKLLEPLRGARGPVSRAALNALGELSSR
jgi:tetratricopeptide (TPR) repeat protein